tara:strand:- start:4408 stop:5913 length:1506 start_codon:yes stop_codon:yes gene_type:complete
VGNSVRTIPESIAAVDLGSNSFHMLIARTKGGEPIVIDRLREMVQLASGLDKMGRLTLPIKQKAIGCLRRFGQRLRHTPSTAVRAVGTNTLRAAENAGEFLTDAEEALGHSIETISGIEEARLIFLGVTQTLPEPRIRRLVIDIGGGSTELIVGKGITPQDMESLYMGCITFSQVYFPDGRLTTDNWRRAELAALQELEPIRERFLRFNWQEVVGASGTIRAVYDLVINYGWDDSGITAPSLRKLRDLILKAGRVDRLKLSGLNPARQSTIAAGIVILLALFDTLSIESMRRSDGALREGLLYDLLGRIRETDVRARSVSALTDRASVDQTQADRVQFTALALLGQVTEDWNLNDHDAHQFLSWAAQLHEIGLDIAHSHHHRHGEYIVTHADLLGFSLPEQQLLATLVRSHRRKFPSSTFSDIPFRWAKVAERLAILLRLAVVLHRSRSPLALPPLRLEALKKHLKLRFPSGWLDEHPLTRADLTTETTYLKAAGYHLSFK